MTRRAVLLAGAALVASAPAAASVPGGAPRLENFRIDDRGTVTRPAPPEAAPAPASPPAPAPEPTDDATSRSAPEPRRVAPSRPVEARPTTVRRPASPEQPVPTPATPAPQAPVDELRPPSPYAHPSPPPIAPTGPVDGSSMPMAEPAPAEPGVPIWAWLLLPIALAGAIVARSHFRRARSGPFDDVGETAEEPGPPLPIAASAPTPSAPAPRPRIELALEPEGATLQDGALEVKFILKIANTGEAAAGNIRVASKLLSGGREVEEALAEFYTDPLLTAPRLANMPAGQAGGLRGRVRMGADALRTLLIEDRALLVPVVAVSLRYDWDGGEGQTARSFVVGRELDPPAERMAALPANAQPRVYRGLGTRPHALAKVA